MSENNVFNLRQQKGMTQERFSEFCNVSKISIVRYEHGDKPSRENAIKIANACGVSTDYVVGNDSNEKSDDISYIREAIRSNPNMQILLKAAVQVSPSDIDTAVKVLQAFKGDSD